MGWEDPYAKVFAAASGDKSPCSILPEDRWREFLSQLVVSGLLTSETVARFSTDVSCASRSLLTLTYAVSGHLQYRGERSFTCFRDQLVRFVAPDHSLKGLEDVTSSLDTHVALAERMLREHMDAGDARDVPPFWSRASDRVSEISHELKLITDHVRRDLSEYADGKSRLGGATHGQLQHAWQYQREHARWLQTQLRRRKPKHVSTLMSSADARKELLGFFPRCLRYFSDITLEVVVAETQDRGSSARATTETVLMLTMSRSRASDESIAWIDSYTAACSELLMSPYFVPYIGSSERIAESSGEILRQYYFELPPTSTLEHLIRVNTASFDGDTSVAIRHVAREVLSAFIDLHEQSTFTLSSPILPNNIFVSSSARRIVVGKLDFGTAYDPFGIGSAVAFAKSRESALLGDFARLLFAMRYHSTVPSNIDDFTSLYLGQGGTISSYAHEFLISPESVDEITLRVCIDDKFSIIIISSNSGSWTLDTEERREGLCLFECRSAPVPTFTFEANEPGTYLLVFCHENSGKQVAVSIIVRQTSFLRSPFSPVSRIVRRCARSSFGNEVLSLRTVLDDNLFYPLSTRDMETLDSALSASLA